MLGTTRPRRFSLIYSSESSLSDVSDSDKNKSTNQHKIKKKAKNISNNSQGKKSKLIQRQPDNDEEGTESSDYQAITNDEESGNSGEESEEEDDDDDDEDDDSDSCLLYTSVLSNHFSFCSPVSVPLYCVLHITPKTISN